MNAGVFQKAIWRLEGEIIAFESQARRRHARAQNLGEPKAKASFSRKYFSDLNSIFSHLDKEYIPARTFVASAPSRFGYRFNKFPCLLFLDTVLLSTTDRQEVHHCFLQTKRPEILHVNVTVEVPERL